MSGPCTNCTDLTLGRQQHALFHIITFYYPPCHISERKGDRKHSAQLVPRLNESAARPCFVKSGCVHHPLEHSSRFNGGLALSGAGLRWWLAALWELGCSESCKWGREGESLDEWKPIRGVSSSTTDFSLEEWTWSKTAIEVFTCSPTHSFSKRVMKL